MSDSRRMLTEAQMSERCDLSPRTLQRLRQNGDGPPYVRLSARRLAYPEKAAEAWIAERTHKSRADELAKAARRVTANNVPADEGSI